MGSIFNRIWWGGDPDELNEETGLSRRDIYNITRSWAVMFADQEKYGLELFLRLFRMNPESKKYFKLIQHLQEEEIRQSSQFKAHVINLMNSVNSAVVNIHQPAVVVALMNKLGESHQRRRIRKLHFAELKVVLVDILKNEMKASDDVVASWARFVTFIYRHIFKKLVVE